MNESNDQPQPDATVTIEIWQTRRGTEVSTHVTATQALGPAVPGILSQMATATGEQMAGVIGSACRAHADALAYQRAPIFASRPNLPTVRDPRIGVA